MSSDSLVTPPAAPAARALRRQVRRWRRGHAELNLWDVASDAYIAVFATVMVGSMATSVVMNLRLLTDDTCSGTCAQVRAMSPWLSALTLVVLALALARLLGPVFSPPAANTWLLSSPVDRGDLLRPQLVRTLAAVLVATAALLVTPVALGGLDASSGAMFVAAWALVTTGVVALAANAQVRERAGLRLLTWVVAALWWGGLAAAAFAPGRVAGWQDRLDAGSSGWWPVALVAVVAVALVLRATAGLAHTRARVLARTSRVVPSLSGALAALELPLLYDVLLARRWSGAARVTTHVGGPRGWWALVHRDVLRAVRAPQPWAVLAGFVLVPYAFAAGGAGRFVVLATTLAGLLAGPALCAGLRVVTRTDALARMLPYGDRALRAAHLVVPGCGLLAFGLASSAALRPALSWPDAVLTGLACGLASLAASMHWIVARPPDYGRPLLSTPAGAVPPGMVAGVFKGFDVWLVTALPLVHTGWGPAVSAGISAAVIAYHLHPSSPGRPAAPSTTAA